ncbi:MAG: TRAP transporter substrate-binding protein DctP, partial [Betaproteobacteria bacterium]
FAGNLRYRGIIQFRPRAHAAIVAWLALGMLLWGGPFGVLPVAAESYKPEYKLSTAVGPAYPWGKGAEIWAQLISERTAGRIKIKQFPGAAAVAGDPAREFAALRDGSIDLAVGSSLHWSAQARVLNLFALPFFIRDHNALDALLRGAVGVAVLRKVEEAGIVPLAWGDNEFREISTAQRAVRKPDDLAGQRIRVGGSQLIDEALLSLGAIPSRSKWLDAQKALLEGTLQGQDTTAQAFIATKAYTLGQRQFLLWALAADPLLFAVSRAAWDGWTPEDRELVRQAAIEAAAREIELARRGSATAEATIARELASTGVSLIRLSAEERAAFAEATKPVFDKWATDIGPELVSAAQAAMATAALPGKP